MLECVVNVSEGRDRAALARLASAAADHLLDLHFDPDHNRSVLTLAGADVEAAARAVATVAVEVIDLEAHSGVHPRLGAVDVVPFTPLEDAGAPVGPSGDLAPALEARARFATWAAEELRLPCFFYGPERSLPEVRRQAFAEILPDRGPLVPHPTAGACAVGARPALVAYNLWLETGDVSMARAVAGSVRGPHLRTLGLAVGTPGRSTQVSCNLVDPGVLGPAQAYDAVMEAARAHGTQVVRAELVGLAPSAVVEAVPAGRREQLDLDLERTVEARLAARAG